MAQVQLTTGTAGAGSAVVTFASATANNLIVIAVSIRNSPIATLTTPSGYTLAVGLANTDASTQLSPRVAIFYKVAAGGETGVTISASVGVDWAWCATEWSGMNATPGDTFGSGDSVGASVATLATGPTATLAQAAELVIIVLAINNITVTALSFPSMTTEANFLSSSALGGQHTFTMGSTTVASTAAFSNTPTWTGAGRATSAIATFKVAASGTFLAPRVLQAVRRASFY